MEGNGTILYLRVYYLVKPLLPVWLRLLLRRLRAHRKLRLHSNIWPIDSKLSRPPVKWTGWPEQKKFALILTHDVDTSVGHDNCKQLIDLEERHGFRSAVYFVPERYQVSNDLREYITSRGFEVGVHGLNHDGKLYWSKRTFEKRSSKINQYIKKWNSVGFRSPAMHFKPSWLHNLDIEYDSSTFDTDPFEPYASSLKSIYPTKISGNDKTSSYIELPYTMPQDWTLYIILKETNINIWKQKLDWIAQHGGMALLITHPDYMNWNTDKTGTCLYPVNYYEELLNYIKSKYHGQYWHALPKDVARFWAKTMETCRNQTP